MEYEFYADVFFLIVFLMNLPILALTAVLGGRRIKPGRLILAALFGSLWNCLTFLVPLLPVSLELFLTLVLCGSIMNCLAFSIKRPQELVKADVLLLISAMLLGGGLSAIKETFSLSGLEACACLSALCGAFAAFAGGYLKERQGRRETCPVRLYYRGNMREFLALVDSGNRLREPESKKPVSVISYEDCQGFCERISGILYIPYRAVGTRKGVLPGIIFERMEIQVGEECLEIDRPVVAVTKEPLSGNGDFSMLLPESLLFSRCALFDKRKEEE